MTPLAMLIAKQLLLRQSIRTIYDNGNILSRMEDIHCFECTGAIGLARDLSMHIPVHGTDERTTFLPFDRTWIEWFEDGNRKGLLLEDKDDEIDVTVSGGRSGYRIDSDGNDCYSYHLTRSIPKNYIKIPDDADTEVFRRRMVLTDLGRDHPGDELIIALLAIINTPRIVGQNENHPHKGFAKKVLRDGGIVRVNPWREIRLSYNSQSKNRDSYSSSITGGRALHFCRSHIRIKKGRLEMVRPYMRGNAENGIKLSDYRVTT